MQIAGNSFPSLPNQFCIDTDAQALRLLPAHSLIQALYRQYRRGNLSPQQAWQKVMAEWREFWQEEDRAILYRLREKG